MDDDEGEEEEDSCSKRSSGYPDIHQVPPAPFSSFHSTASRWAQLLSSNGGEPEAEGDVLPQTPQASVAGHWPYLVQSSLSVPPPGPASLMLVRGRGCRLAGGWGGSAFSGTSVFLA